VGKTCETTVGARSGCDALFFFRLGFLREGSNLSKKSAARKVNPAAICTEDFGALVHAFCLMPNHFHLISQVQDIPLASIMHSGQPYWLCPEDVLAYFGKCPPQNLLAFLSQAPGMNPAAIYHPESFPILSDADL
jgi:hypothetical protein